MVSVRWLHGSRTLSELRYIVEDQLFILDVILGSEAWGIKQKKNVLFTAETQADFFCFIPPTKSRSQV